MSETILQRIERNTAALPAIEQVFRSIADSLRGLPLGFGAVGAKGPASTTRSRPLTALQAPPALQANHIQSYEPGPAPKKRQASLPEGQREARPAPTRDKMGRFVNRAVPQADAVRIPSRPAVEATTPVPKQAPTLKAAKPAQRSGVPRQSQEPTAKEPGSAAAQIQKESREKRVETKRDSLLVKAIGGAGKGIAAARDFIAGRSGANASDAAGMAAGGPVWSAIREITEAVDMTGDNRMVQAAFAFVKKRWKGKGTAEEGVRSGTRDEHGRFIPKAEREKQGKPPADRGTEMVEAVTRVEEAIENTDAREARRHRKLVKEVDGIHLQQAEGGILDGISGVRNLFKGRGGLKGAAKSAMGAGGGAVKAVSKGAGRALGKLGGAGVVKGAGKLLGKAGGSILKKVPGLGLLAGGAFAANRAMDGDYLGAAGEMGSGLASIVPGIGTAVSTAIDAALMARDISAPIDKEIKGSLQSDPKQDKIATEVIVTPGTEPGPVSRLEKVREVPRPEPPPQRAQAPERRVAERKAPGRADRRGNGYHVPVEFDDTLLTLMSVDRI
ncbi:MAG: hypothetical protein ABIL58_23280 [Pseudomonadota bacterium]